MFEKNKRKKERRSNTSTRQTFKRKIDNILELPEEVSTQTPKVTILGFEKMLVENYKGILEYEEFYIRLSTYIGIININGFNLAVNEMTSEDVLITGKIESFDFERTEI